MTRLLLASLCLCLAWVAPPSRADVPATAPPVDRIDPGQLKRLEEIDGRVGQVKDMTADFEQRKYTAMLKKPLVSTGVVQVKGQTMRWDTAKPTPSVMLIDEKEARLYYPERATMEVYKLDQRLGELATSPLQRLATLRSHFAIEAIAPQTMAERGEAVAYGEADYVALKLVPKSEKLREHVEQVRVLLDARAAYIVKAELTDADGDRTVITFGHVKTNAGLGDLGLTVPPGTKVTRPMESLEGGGGGGSGGAREGQHQSQ